MTNATTLQHTPGPWHVDDEHGSLVIRNGGLIADIGPAHKEANARLIVTSPELLDALREVMGQVGGFLPRKMERDARAVIKKAEGS